MKGEQHRSANGAMNNKQRRTVTMNNMKLFALHHSFHPCAECRTVFTGTGVFPAFLLTLLFLSINIANAYVIA